MSIQHQDILDANRHEPKGASTATANQVLKSNGDGTTSFGSYAYSDLSGKPTSTGYSKVILGSSTSSTQAPSAVDSAIKIEFGTAQSTTDVDLAVDGTITFNTAGYYAVDAVMKVGRVSSSGDAIVLVRPMYNGSQFRPSAHFKMSNNDYTQTHNEFLMFEATAGDTLYFELVRDSSGVNNGGLFSLSPSTSGWQTSPTAQVVIHKFGGLV